MRCSAIVMAASSGNLSSYIISTSRAAISAVTSVSPLIYISRDVISDNVSGDVSKNPIMLDSLVAAVNSGGVYLVRYPRPAAG